jgi:hypothetical protein
MDLLRYGTRYPFDREAERVLMCSYVLFWEFYT